MVKPTHLLGLLLATCALVLADPSASKTRGDDDPALKSHSVAIGKLIKSGKSRNGTERFALLDPDGAVTAYVIASTGAELSPHVNQQVGITASAVRRGPDSIPYLLARKVSRLKAPAGEKDQPRLLPSDIRADALAQAIAEFSQPADGTLAELMWQDVSEPVVQTAAQEVFEEPVPTPAGLPMPMPMDGSMIVEPGSYYPGPPGMGQYVGSSGCGVPGCTSCGGRRLWRRGRWWVRAEYLSWRTKGMSIPPLITTSEIGTRVGDAGVLGLDSTHILVGGEDVLKQARNGGRLTIGRWFSPCRLRGIELEVFGIGRESQWLAFCSPGDPILARPFYNVLLDEEDSELVAYPGIVAGKVGAAVDSELSSFALRYRMNLRSTPACPRPAAGCSDCGGGCGPVSCRPMGNRRLDLVVGYRYMRLDEALLINERLGTLDSNTPSTFDLTDVFGTRSEFNGAEFGLVWEACRGPWSVEMLGRLSAGNSRRQVAVAGATTSSAQGVTFKDPGGLLALSSNMGVYQDDKFIVIPEIGVSAAYQVSKRLRFLIGYSFLYWDKVFRPGDQIDLRVNTDLLPPPVDTEGPRYPRVTLRDSSYWAQGVNIGFDARW